MAAVLTWGEFAAAAAPGGRDRGRIADQYLVQERGMAEEPPGFDDEQLFEPRVNAGLTTKTTGHGDWNPQHSVWKA